MTKNEIEEVLQAKFNITEQTRKNYRSIYNKIINEIDGDIQDAEQEDLINLVMKLSKGNPSVALTYLNVVIITKKHFNLKSDLLGKKQLELREKRVEHTSSLIEKKKEELPSYDTLKKHMNSLYDVGNCQSYIIHYILLNYGVRNMDLNLFITERKNVKNIEDGRNYIFVKSTECEIVINNYKTIETFGQKRFTIKSKKFKDACIGHGLNNYLLYTDGDKTKPIAESGLSTYLKRRIYNQHGESDIFKILVKHSQSLKNPLQELQRPS